MSLISTAWDVLLYHPLLNLLMFFYQALGGNLGLAIIGVTVLIRLILIPLTLPSMQSAQKMQTLKPELDKLKKQFGNDKQGLAKAQMELYKRHNLNPAAGLLPMIVQIVVLIALFNAFNQVLKPTEGVGELNQVLYSFIKLPQTTTLSTRFLYLDLLKPDIIHLPFSINILGIVIDGIPGILLLLAAALQGYSSWQMLPKTNKSPDSSKKPDANDQEDMALAMQKQMSFLMPLMTLVIGFRFPSGLVLYWLVFSILLIIQQMYLKKSNLYQTASNIKSS